jgi:hypothetical protein
MDVSVASYSEKGGEKEEKDIRISKINKYGKEIATSEEEAKNQ